MMISARLSLALFALTLVARAADAQSALPKSSPFLPAASASGPAASANETLEFAGVSAVGKRTDLILYDKGTKKNHWIGVGETKDGISVVSYDAKRDQAIVKVNGTEKALTLRKGAGPTNSPASVAPMPIGFNVAPAGPVVTTAAAPVPNAVSPATPTPAMSPAPQPAAPAAPATPEAQAKAETEARMLVSDLLEIGMAQRKAYEEAQRKAAEGKANAAPAPAPKQ